MCKYYLYKVIDSDCDHNNNYCYCYDVTAIDDGEALQKRILAEKSLLANNFPKGLMTIACVATGANYDLVVKKFGECALPVLFGAPQSAKTTALKAALSVVGNTDSVQGMWWSMLFFTQNGSPKASFININERDTMDRLQIFNLIQHG